MNLINYADQERGSAYGAALSAATNYGVYNDLQEAFQSVSSDLNVTHPVTDYLDIYREAFSLY